MKYILLIISLTALNSVKAQGDFKIFGDLQAGAGVTVSGESMQHATAGINAILPNSIYLRLGADLAFGGSFTDPNVLISYTQYGLRLGTNREITEKLAIRPYLGIGYQSAIVTTSKSNSLVDELEVVGVETRYQSELISSVSVPMGVDFHFHKKNLGLTTGVYLNASNYTEIGIRLGLTFGKL